MKYFVVMMFLFMTSGVFVAKDNNVCIKILDVDGIRLKGVEVKIYEAGKGWQISSTDENGDAYFTVSPINHCDVFVKIQLIFWIPNLKQVLF